jgi:hypothetical protein
MTDMKTHCGNTFEVMHLLEEILDGFTDEYCRPTNQITLYEKYVQLRQTYDARLVRHLIVIPGGRPGKPLAPKDHPAQKAQAFGKANTTAVGVTSAKQLS